MLCAEMGQQETVGMDETGVTSAHSSAPLGPSNFPPKIRYMFKDEIIQNFQMATAELVKPTLPFF